MSFFTSFCDLPQNEQRNVSSVLLTILEGKLLRKSKLLRSNHRRLRNLGAGDHLVVTANTFITDECTFANHLSRNASHALGSASHDLCHLALLLVAERATKSFGFHSSYHRQVSKLLRSQISNLNFRSEILGSRLLAMRDHLVY